MFGNIFKRSCVYVLCTCFPSRNHCPRSLDIATLIREKKRKKNIDIFGNYF